VLPKMQKLLLRLNNNVKDFVVPSTFGVSSIFAIISLHGVMSFLVAAVTIAAMAPVAINRWEVYLEKRRLKKLGVTIETKNPFEDS
jgi:hypothetical protein